MNPATFKDHIVFDKVSQLNQSLSEIETIENVEIDDLSFLKTATLFISDRLKISIPELVIENELNALISEIDTGLQQVNTFIGNQNQGHLKNARNNLVAAINRIRNFPLTLSKGDFNFANQIATFQKTITDKYKSIENENNQALNQLEGLKQEILANKSVLDKINQLLNEKEAQIQNLNSKFQTDYDNFKSTISQQIEADRNTFKNEIDSDTSELIQKLNDKLEEASKIVSVIGNIGVTGNYNKIANEHKRSANSWRIIAIVFMLALSGLLIWTIFDLSSENYDWKISIARIIGAAILTYPATYAARESSKHRKLETINRTAELELASINPFIETLDEDKKQMIKEKLVEKYFGNTKSENDESDEELSISGFEKILKALTSIISK